ncbi:MAG TPA: hypothetical protein PKV93_12480 [Fervidobacterium sp.]|nr:hypothetical protein [Fervidobacterium sp.]
MSLFVEFIGMWEVNRIGNILSVVQRAHQQLTSIEILPKLFSSLTDYGGGYAN